jgi:hypothetical protein
MGCQYRAGGDVLNLSIDAYLGAELEHTPDEHCAGPSPTSRSLRFAGLDGLAGGPPANLAKDLQDSLTAHDVESRRFSETCGEHARDAFGQPSKLSAVSVIVEAQDGDDVLFWSADVSAHDPIANVADQHEE